MNENLRIALGFLPAIALGVVVHWAMFSEPVLRLLRPLAGLYHKGQTNLLVPKEKNPLALAVIGNPGPSIPILGFIALFLSILDAPTFQTALAMTLVGATFAGTYGGSVWSIQYIKDAWEPIQPSGRTHYFAPFLLSLPACLVTSLSIWAIRTGFPFN